MDIKPKLGMIVIVKDDNNQDHVAVIQDIHISGQRFWITFECEPYGPMHEVMIRNNGAWKTKSGRRSVELTTQNEYHNHSLSKRAA